MRISARHANALRKPLAAAMHAVHDKFPDDPEVAAMMEAGRSVDADLTQRFGSDPDAGDGAQPYDGGVPKP